jgi:hypothetical protein
MPLFEKTHLEKMKNGELYCKLRFVHAKCKIVAVVVGKSHDVFMDKSKSKSNSELTSWLSTGMAQLLTHVSLLYG